MNSQHKKTDSKGDLYLNVCFKDFWYTRINLTQIWYDELKKYILMIVNKSLIKHHIDKF